MKDQAGISDRLIVALDVPNNRQALEIVAQLEGSVQFYKVGLELFASGAGLQLIDQLASQGYKVFADFKFLDIPQTVYRAVKNLSGRGIEFLTVHAESQTMQAAVDATDDISVLAVTVLTSLNDQSIQAMGFGLSTVDLVKKRAIDAHENGCAGVIASPQEARLVRQSTSADFRIVTPGIREQDTSTEDDQERTMGIAQAFAAGSDYVVVGRPIRDANDPLQAALNLQAKIPISV